MHYRFSPRLHARLLLALFALLIALGGLAPAQLARSAPLPIAIAADEQELNNTVQTATSLAFSINGDTRTAQALGTIDAVNDAKGAQGDWYKLTAIGGATLTVSLGNLPDDYDLALFTDPLTKTVAVSDSLDMSNIADLGNINALSAQPGTAGETISAYLASPGDYYLFVFSAAGGFSDSQKYTLDVTLKGGALALPTTRARPALGLGTGCPLSNTITTLVLHNSARMGALYPAQTGDVAALTTNLTSGSFPSQANSYTLDLSSLACVSFADRSQLNALYAEWDANADNPLYANEVAQQIWFIANRLISDRLPNISDLVLVGGDSVLPFYRTPDETVIANEADYAQELGAGAGKLNPARPLYNSLFYRYVLTDNFYGDRQPTAWRGRALFVPDLGVGRLVESPPDINRYLQGYISTGSYTIRGDLASAAPAHYGGALVTGYDFLLDQAQAIGGQFVQYGYRPGATVATTYTLNTALANNSWNADDMAGELFSGQLPQLGSSYSGPHTNYQLVSLNGHFTHYQAIPADTSAGLLRAERILTPTAATAAQGFFRDWNANYGDSPSLTYSVGCHSGLSVIDGETLGSATPSPYAADFANAYLRQGGNWIGNTGYGYGDSDLVGYSERLSLLLTKAIGRQITDGPGGDYIGPKIGEALARAKRQYLYTAGPGSFSVYDEKVIAQMTLYGLPFIRVKVPKPSAPQYGSAFDPPPQNIPAALQGNPGTFTRVLTFTNEFKAEPGDNGQVQRVRSGVRDSFQPGKLTFIDSVDQMAIGRPVLPTLSYDITLKQNPQGAGSGIPQPRGVRLLRAITLSDISRFNPNVTTVVSDVTEPLVGDTLLNLPKAWMPDRPFGAQRTLEGGSPSDKLVVTPVQFRAVDTEAGWLRRFSQLVIEITYADPRQAAPATLGDTTAPSIRNLGISITGNAPGTAGLTSILVSATVTDTGGSAGAPGVTVFYAVDGQLWQSAPLLKIGASSYQGSINTSASGGNVVAFVAARDSAGNVATQALKGTLSSAFSLVYLPTARR